MSSRLLLVIAVLALATPASAQYFFENFDSYPLGQLASGTGGWYGWDNVPTVTGDIVDPTTLAMPFIPLSAANCLEINYPDDTIQPWVLNDPTGHPTAGVWRLTGWWYIPGAQFTGSTGGQYILIQNTYNHGGPYTWALELQADPATMTLLDYHRVEAPVPVLLDQWVEVKVDIDLTADTIAVYYGGTLVSSGTYTTGAGQPLAIACLDLFTTSTTNVAYWDEIKLELLPFFDATIACNPAAGTVDFSVVNGTPGNTFYIAAAAIYTGVAPNGWFYGINLTFAELVAQVQLGNPFVGVIGAGGAFTFPFPVPPGCGTFGIPLDYVGLEYGAGTTAFIQASPAKTITL